MWPGEAVKLAVDEINDEMARAKIKCFRLRWATVNGSIIIEFDFPDDINDDGTATSYNECNYKYEAKEFNDKDAYIKEIRRLAKKHEDDMKNDLYSFDYTDDGMIILDKIWTILKGE